VSIIAVSGDQAKEGPGRIATLELPGAGTSIVFDAAAELVEVLGATPDGTGTTVYVIEPHGRSVFADHDLPFVPQAIALDHEAAYPAESRGEILAFGPDGETASLDVGHYPFAWRLPGVLLGALMAAAVYLLARLLFRRRDVAVLAGLFVLLDGMFFVQSRIAMNDVYTGCVHPRRLPHVRVAVAAAARMRAFVRPDCRWWACCWASPWRTSGSPATRSVRWGILVLVRSALGRLTDPDCRAHRADGVLGWMALASARRPRGERATSPSR